MPGPLFWLAARVARRRWYPELIALAHVFNEEPDAAAAIRRFAERAVDLAGRDQRVRVCGAHPVDGLQDVAVGDARAGANDHRWNGRSSSGIDLHMLLRCLRL
jgi:hypothetical protein